MDNKIPEAVSDLTETAAAPEAAAVPPPPPTVGP